MIYNPNRHLTNGVLVTTPINTKSTPGPTCTLHKKPLTHPLRLMTINLFDQFISPHILGIPLITAALLTPSVLIKTCPRLTSNRTAAVQAWVVTVLIKQLFTPLSKPGHT